MTPSISELHGWFRSERLSAAHNALYEILVQGAPADVLASATFLLARLKIGAGQIDSALLQLQGSASPGRQDRARHRALMALGYALKRCFRLAGRAIQDALSTAGDDPFVVLLDAMVKVERGELLASAVEYRRAGGDHADRRFALRGLAEVLRAAGDPDGATGALEDLASRDGDWAGTHRALAYHAMTLGDHEQALVHFDRALEVAPDGDLAPLDRFGRARALHAAGRDTEAIAAWQALGSEPHGPATMAMRAASRLGEATGERSRTLLPTRPARLLEDTDLPPALSLYERLQGRQPEARGPSPLHVPAWSVLEHLSQGHETLVFEGRVDDVKRLVDAGIPVLTFEQAHVGAPPSVVLGYDDALGELLVLDPLTGLLHETGYEHIERAGSPPAAIAAIPAGGGSPSERSGVAAAPHLERAVVADGLRDAGRPEEAEAVYRDALAADPGCEHAHAGLIGVLLGRMATDLTRDALRRDVEEAIGSARESARDPALVHRSEGRVRRLLGQHGKALGSFRKASAAQPDDIHTLCEQASCLITTGSADEGASLLREALEIAPFHPRPNLDLADHHAGRGDLVPAEHFVRCGLDLDPASAYGHEVLALVLRRRGDPEQALSEIDRAVHLGSDTDWVHVERAACLMDLERWSEALPPLETAVERDGTNAEARRRLVQVLVRLGRGPEAVEASRFLLSVEPTSAAAHELHGLALETASMTVEAERAYMQSLEISPEHLPALHRLDALLARDARTRDRAALWLVSARRDPANPDLLVGLAGALEADGMQEAAAAVLGRAAIAGGGPVARKLEALREQCTASPDPRAVLEEAASGQDRAAILAELGRVLLMAGDPDAPSVWRRVVEHEPDDPVAIAMLAHSMRMEDRRRHEMDEQRDPAMLAAAAQALDHVLELEPHWIWARAERGQLALDMNQPRAALAVLEPVAEDRSAVWEVRMAAHASLGDHERASRAGDRLLESPDASPHPGLRIRVAQEHGRAGHDERARELAGKALESLPPGPSALRRTAESLLE